MHRHQAFWLLSKILLFDNARKRELNEIMKQRYNTQTIVNTQTIWK